VIDVGLPAPRGGLCSEVGRGNESFDRAVDGHDIAMGFLGTESSAGMRAVWVFGAKRRSRAAPWGESAVMIDGGRGGGVGGNGGKECLSMLRGAGVDFGV
jgi:hypothetical protein